MKEYIVFLDRATLIAELSIPDFDHVWVEHPETPPEEAADRLWRATVAITNKVPITRDVLERCHKLRLVAVAATGVNNVDLEACREKGVAVILHVWDTGEGIPPDLETRFFEPFAASPSSKGGGLGLTICAEIADSMSAHLTLRNRVHEGEVAGADAIVRFNSTEARLPLLP